MEHQFNNIKMVIQRNWKDSNQQNSSSEDSNGSWQFQAPGKLSNRQPTYQNSGRPAINRQVAINALAAMHRRFNLPGSMPPHSRPVAEFRASANKSLDILRQTIQSSVTKEIDQIIKKYLEKFFVPAVNNIRLNLGEDSVSEDQVRAVCRAMLDATRTLYVTPPRPTASPCDISDSESSNGGESRCGRPNSSPSYNKRKESDTDSDTCSIKRKRIKQEDIDLSAGGSGSSSPALPINRDPDKWNPDRLKEETLFIMGSHAHRVLGLGNSRGRLYTKHSGLLRYPADTIDKEWIASHNLMNPVGGKTYIMVLEDIEELAATDHYKHNALPLLAELTGFRAPAFMLQKMKAFLTKKMQSKLSSTSPSPQPSTSTSIDCTDFIKKEHDEKLQDEYPVIKIEDTPSNNEAFNHIKVDNICDFKVEDIKVEDQEYGICKSENDHSQIVGLLDADIEFLSRNLGNLENEAEARKTIEKLTGANPDTLTLVGDEFDFGSALNTNMGDMVPGRKCITVASTSSGLVHTVPVSHLQRFTRNNNGIPINTKGCFSTVMSQGTAGVVNIGHRASSTATVIGNTVHYVSSSNFLQNAIVSRNIMNRANVNVSSTSTITNTVKPIQPTEYKQINRLTTKSSDVDNISTMKDMIDNACNSSLMLKKVLTLGAANKSFLMHNTQKVLSGLSNSSVPPNVTVLNSNMFTSASHSLSATHATLTALLSAQNEKLHPTANNDDLTKL